MNTAAEPLLVFLHPHKTPTEAFRRRLTEYVTSGGRILIVDSAGNPHSTTNDLLASFSIRVNCARAIAGRLKTDAWSEVAVEKAAEVAGGRPFALIDGHCVGVSIEHGRGRVTVMGFGSRFTDAQMGVTGDVVPDEKLRRVFDLQFALLRQLVERQPR